MNLYHSGISSPVEYGLLCEAGSPHLLADIIDTAEPRGPPRRGLARFARVQGQARPLARRTAARDYGDLRPDRAGRSPPSPRSTASSPPRRPHRNWLALRARGIENLIPVWQWRSGRSRLREYLDSAPVVGLGGLVDALHAEDAETLDQLSRLCEAFPRRFHVFGLMWLAALQRPLAAPRLRRHREMDHGRGQAQAHPRQHQ